MRADGMGRKRIIGLEWLDPINTEQRLWARAYLRTKGFEKHFHFRDKVLPTELPSHQEMLHAGMEIEQEAGARELFRDMKDAWRQEKSRNKKKETGRQVCAFTFSATSKANLQEMAQKKGTNATALLEKLIARAYKADQPKTATKKKEQPLQVDQRPSLDDIYDHLSGNAVLDGEQAIQNPPTEGSSTDAISAPEKITIADNQVREMRGSKSTPDTHEQIDSPQAQTSTDDELALNAERAKKSISDLLTLKAENKAARAKQARPPSPPPEQIETTATAADSPPTTRSDEQS
jgi:hypothetical protein